MVTKAQICLENSFLKPLLQDPENTDISYNGDRIYCQNNTFGRSLTEIMVKNDDVKCLLKQISNLTNSKFSYSVPILDVSFGPYRLNAVHESIARFNNIPSYTFSLRIGHKGTILESGTEFFTGDSEKILLKAIEDNESIMIGGLTGTGKTELEKYLLSKMTNNKRVIVIDNVEELNLINNDNIDLNTWVVADRYNNSSSSYASLIKNSLRNNPDYIVLAESRGAETLDAVNCVMSGHPLITSIHSKDYESIPSRIVRLCMQGNKNLDASTLLDDIKHHIHYYVYVCRTIDKNGRIHRFIDKIAYLDDKNKKFKVLVSKEE